MSVSYRFTAHTRDGRDISATLNAAALIAADQADVYFLPGQDGFGCSSCRGFHFLQRPSYQRIQYNDSPTGDAYSYDFPAGTFQQFGSYQARDVGSGPGHLDVVDVQPQPVTLVSNMDQSSDKSWGFAAGATFEQRFKARAGGTPTELGVRMGNNQNPYGVRVRIAVDGTGVFDRSYTGLVQRRSDWATVFPLDGLPAVAAGAWVTVSLTPDTEVGIEPIFSTDPDVPQGELPRYGAMAMRFYVNGMSPG